VFPTSDAVNEALRGLLQLAEKTSKVTRGRRARWVVREVNQVGFPFRVGRVPRSPHKATKPSTPPVASVCDIRITTVYPTDSGVLTPLELIPPPRRHRHRDYGVLAPNAPLRSAVTAPAGS
jgi:hypothetical protein